MTRRALILPAAALLALAAALPVLAEETPFAQLPYTPSLDVSAMDRTADPCEDLYQYSCGGWMKNNPMPGDQANWSVYGKLSEDNQRYLWGLLAGRSEAERRSAAPRSRRSATTSTRAWTSMPSRSRGCVATRADLDRIAAIEVGRTTSAATWARSTPARPRARCSSGPASSRMRRTRRSRSWRSMPGASASPIATTTSRTTRSRRSFAPSTSGTSRTC